MKYKIIALSLVLLVGCKLQNNDIDKSGAQEIITNGEVTKEQKEQSVYTNNHDKNQYEVILQGNAPDEPIATVTDNTNVVYTINSVKVDEHSYDVKDKVSFYVDMTLENNSNKEQFIVYPDLWKADGSGQIGDQKAFEDPLDRKMHVGETVNVITKYEVPSDEREFILKVGNVFQDVPITINKNH